MKIKNLCGVYFLAFFVALCPKNVSAEIDYTKEILYWNVFILKYGLGWDTLPNNTVIMAHNCLQSQVSSGNPLEYELFILSMHTHYPAERELTLKDVVAYNEKKPRKYYRFFLKDFGTWGYSVQLNPIKYFTFIRGSKEKNIQWGHFKWMEINENAFRSMCVRKSARFVPPGFFKNEN